MKNEKSEEMKQYHEKIDRLAGDLKDLRAKDVREYQFMKETLEELDFADIEMSFEDISAMIGNDTEVVNDYTKAMYLLMQIEDAFEQVEENAYNEILELKGDQ
jgi:prefoldin subunit 5